MVTLAAIPGVSVMTVVAGAAFGGWRHALAATSGIVAGDLIYIAIAIFGLGTLSAFLGGYAYVVPVLCGLYLIWLGVQLMRGSLGSPEWASSWAQSIFSAFLAGLSITLADQKALLFYLAILPGFVDTANLQVSDVVLICLTMFVAITLPKMSYALLIVKFGIRPSGRVATLFLRLAGLALLTIGAALVAKNARVWPG
jgi:threonine/homoserine/homoserine lactone efflux protein